MREGCREEGAPRGRAGSGQQRQVDVDSGEFRASVLVECLLVRTREVSGVTESLWQQPDRAYSRHSSTLIVRRYSVGRPWRCRASISVYTMLPLVPTDQQSEW